MKIRRTNVDSGKCVLSSYKLYCLEGSAMREIKPLHLYIFEDLYMIGCPQLSPGKYVFTTVDILGKRHTITYIVQ